MNKIKKIFLTLILSICILFNNVSSSFANPLVVAPVTISYELLMALMGIGVTFGLALPKDDVEYWDYTRSLKRHLQVVDDDYLDKLDKSVKEWKTNNNNKPDNEKDPLQVPFIPGLETLFKKVFDDRSKTMEYINNALTSDNVYTSYKDINNVSFVDLPFTLSYINAKGTSTNLECSLTNKNLLQIKTTTSDGYERVYISAAAAGTWELMKTGYVFYKDSNNRISPMIVGVYNNNVDRWVDDSSQGLTYYYSYPSKNVNPTYNSKPIEGEYTKPDVENDILNIGTLPELSIPNPESLPGFENGAQRPFDVQDPISPPNTETPPGTDTETPPGTDTGNGGNGGNSSLPSFPSWGNGIDFSPITESDISDKFPFCLAKDLSNIIKVFDVEEKAPVFDVPFLGEVYQIDLAQFTLWASIIKFFVLVTFIFGLIKITRGIIG